ncbi:uncharacterized protein LOC134655460 [Cydia amplana]|uniref:uncharacterized protein LOC134655460 n=1 Tax=Cydia amplana TaxID=1869771 RepID=UPI002FE5A8F6
MLENLRVVINSVVADKLPTDVKIKPITSDGANFTSFIFEITVVTAEGTLELFAKVATNRDIEHVFVTENFVYSTLSKAYESLQNLHGSDQIFTFPKFYKTEAIKGVQNIVLENLASEGYKCHDRLKSMDWKYASKCVETLANFHALSLAFGKEDPEQFKQVEESLKLPPLTDPEWRGLADGALAAVDGVDREKLSKLLEGSVGWSKLRELNDPRKTPVIIHGDYRPSNLMHREVNGDLHVIPVDYQLTGLGCPASDLIYFIVLGSDQQFRQKYYHKLVDHYYQELVLAMTRLGLKPEVVYGRQEFEEDMRAKLPLGLCVAAQGLPFVTTDPANAATFEGGWFVPGSNELFVERFRGLMDDFNRWGFI